MKLTLTEVASVQRVSTDPACLASPELKFRYAMAEADAYP